MSREIELPFAGTVVAALSAGCLIASLFVLADTSDVPLPTRGRAVDTSGPFGPSDWQPEARGFRDITAP
jgi:hypothetical protein